MRQGNRGACRRDAEGGVPYGEERTQSVTVGAGALDSPHAGMQLNRENGLPHVCALVRNDRNSVSPMD